MWVITWEWEWKGREEAGGGNVRAGRAHCALARDQLLNVYASVSRCRKGCVCVCDGRCKKGCVGVRLVGDAPTLCVICDSLALK